MPVYALAFLASTLSWIGGKTWANTSNWWNSGNSASSVIAQQQGGGISTMRLLTVGAVLFGGALLLREFMKVWKS